mgnify:CR=1 FL=1
MPDSIARSSFPRILKRLMEHYGLSQMDIAEKLGVSKQTVSDWVNGKKFPRVDRMQQLSDLFDVLMSDLYSDKEPDAWDRFVLKQTEMSNDEYILLQGYRALPDPGKQYMLQQLTAAKAIYGEKDNASSSSDVG